MYVARAGTLTLAAVTLALSACADGPVAVQSMAPQLSRSADRCVNVNAEVEAQLGLWLLNGQLAAGGVIAPVTLGGIDGYLGSVLMEMRSPGRSQTVQWSLQHIFTTTAPTLEDSGLGFPVPAIDLTTATHWFVTADRAVCAAAGGGPLRCRINDIMNLVDGAGMFAGAEGFLHNHGVITITDPATGAGVGDFHLRGRICGAGVGG